MTSFDLGKVIAVHPEGYAIDVLMYPDGSRVSNVQVMCSEASNNTGLASLRTTGKPNDESAWSFDDTGDGDQIAIIGLIHGMPVCFGFLYPQVAQMLFADKDREIRRHASDWYESIDAEANYEMYHPSGTYLRIGSSPTHEDLTGKDYDGHWEITKNTQSAPHVHLTVSNAGSPVAHFDVDPNGNVTVENDGNTDITTKGNVNANITGTMTGSASAWHITGDITVNGGITTTGDVVAAGVSLDNHTHTGNDGNPTSPPN